MEKIDAKRFPPEVQARMRCQAIERQKALKSAPVNSCKKLTGHHRESILL